MRGCPASRIRLSIGRALAGLPALPRPLGEVRHVPILIGPVEARLGLAVEPQLMVPAAPAALVGLPLTRPEATRVIGIVRRRRPSLSPAATARSALRLQPRQPRAPTACASPSGVTKPTVDD